MLVPETQGQKDVSPIPDCLAPRIPAVQATAPVSQGRLQEGEPDRESKLSLVCPLWQAACEGGTKHLPGDHVGLSLVALSLLERPWATHHRVHIP